MSDAYDFEHTDKEMLERFASKKCSREACNIRHTLRGDFCSLTCAVMFAQELGMYDTYGIKPDGTKELGH